MKVVVLFKDGFEELEALSVVDVLRRAKIPCEMIGMDSNIVTSSHQIKIQMDKIFDESVYQADMVVLPGGLPGATSLRDDQRVCDLLKDFDSQGKWIAAICAGPISLEKTGIVKGKKYTCYPGFENEIVSGLYQDTLVCVDQNIITGRGPAAALEFAYTILEKLGYDSQDIIKGMQYHYLKAQ
ncbi:MAG: DJ-1/PfpI family protein [Coprobacillus sp.]|nr:DJ-1/PfpI family protein [Coprobacillus sp.]